jgi:hypothetical protein
VRTALLAEYTAATLRYRSLVGELEKLKAGEAGGLVPAVQEMLAKVASARLDCMDLRNKLHAHRTVHPRC